VPGFKFGSRRADSQRLNQAPSLSPDHSYRLVTRNDFDGLVCAALLDELGLLDDVLFAPVDV
jgi:hypothetical protein